MKLVMSDHVDFGLLSEEQIIQIQEEYRREKIKAALSGLQYRRLYMHAS